MFGDLGSSPIKIEITLGMLQNTEVVIALSLLIKAMGKAQQEINSRLEQEMKDSSRIGEGLPGAALPPGTFNNPFLKRQ